MPPTALLPIHAKSILRFLSRRPFHLSSLRYASTSASKVPPKAISKPAEATAKANSTPSSPSPPTTPSTPPAQQPPQSPPRDPLEPVGSKNESDHILKRLDRPLGLPTPPQSGQNSGIDPRSWHQRRDDFFDYDKHLERRKELTRKVARPYFRDWSNLRFHNGKIFLAPTRLFRADKALYFPNLRGTTLASPKDEQDTTPLARGRITLVRVFTGTWAQRQADSWLTDNKALTELLTAADGVVHRLEVNLEENRLKAGLVRLFMGSLRRSLPGEMHGRYFLVTKGVDEGVGRALGMYNAQVAYVYLLDDCCRVRWAGSGEALEEEKGSLARAIARLVEELGRKVEAGDKSVDSRARQRIRGLAARARGIVSQAPSASA